MDLKQALDKWEADFERQVQKHGECCGFGTGEFEQYVDTHTTYAVLVRLIEVMGEN